MRLLASALHAANYTHIQDHIAERNFEGHTRDDSLTPSLIFDLDTFPMRAPALQLVISSYERLVGDNRTLARNGVLGSAVLTNHGLLRNTFTPPNNQDVAR